MTWGVRADFYRRVKAEKGRDPPAEFLNPPSLPGHLIFYSDAFWRLHHDRPIGMSVGRIPWLAINEYAKRYNVVGDDFDRFVRLVSAQDTEYLSIYHKRQSNDGAITVDVEDTQALSDMFSRLEARMEGYEPEDETLEEDDHG